MNKLLLAIFASLISSVFAKEVSIADRVKSYEIYLKNYEAVFSIREINRDEEFKRSVKKLNKEIQDDVLDLTKNLDGKLNPHFIKSIIYWKYINPRKIELKQVLNYAMTYQMMIARDYLDNPFSKNKITLLNNLRKDLKLTNLTQDNIIAITSKDIELKSKFLSEIDDVRSLSNGLEQTEYFSKSIYEGILDYNNFSLDPRGIIPGNNVKIISENDQSLERIQWFNERIIFGGSDLDFNHKDIQMPLSDQSNGHIVFKKDPIFKKIKEMIDESKDSIFIDIFLMGGTLGATLSEYLLDQAKVKIQANKNFKLLILHDFSTHYNMAEELMPVFQYIKSRIESDKELSRSVYLLQANIHRHPPGVPFGITNLIPKTDEVMAEMEKKSTYFESKIDHSKVIVIDANTSKPQAYFGSKNWTDHSGGYYYDNTIWVEGPAAALVQHSYYDDIEAALTENTAESKLFYLKDQGFDNSQYLRKKEQILNDFKVKRTQFEAVGSDTLRIAEANVDGRIKNVRNILIDMISHAEDHIFMEQLFLYDKYVIDALIKRKIEKPSLEIKIIIDHNGNFGMNGLPNTLFIRELKSHHIEVRTRQTLGTQVVLKDGSTRTYHQENHRKITSVDGKVLLGGSSNINPDTLQGSFREFGAQIFSHSEISQYEKQFIIDWSDPQKVAEVDIENFQAYIGGKSFSKRISDLLNKIGSQLIRSKDQLEKRY
ncbi:MAG: hypothetical protein COW00_09225 [Bdellovibrio sp. CG12_big_fil_rev_8_21_14_0_65_39_13]|nr:MAG: hypothetical protein COW78_09295 [Bdellovibrio sp. CG22_combo_CG10-13_8_21_14_all_39_27]PIQ59803.1 MAG: hypothetical protein COW00_09225 [Bdellovibrio sp. CG12_big_fil_rev_8_21_14_0_65_39_13]PIR36169.1 MAG: hypothetical protein COV37_04165 [Bdellovibrio sp. CG11_big_fil_rev_8_21_14_0_20_39_38]PJB52773.1 MAG: hypothetical protein CO099_10785 [Bdellovibrio sp. CG_4_9_14_3_um_filter_39_7]